MIDYNSKLLFLGSCFSDHIGGKMKKLKFVVCLNPFGVLFNPISLANSIQLLLEKKAFKKSDLSFNNELWFSFAHYTIFSDIDPDRCLDKINQNFFYAQNFIRNADIVILTLGTSWIYSHKDTGKVVANCHKLPSSNFSNYFSTPENSFNHIKGAVDKLRKINPLVKIIFTVSPIRHWKDGAIENQRSKASLILCIAKLQQELKDIYYFPAYEIFMDELRDYRYYAEDMFHPSDFAIDYIWKRFMQTFFAGDALRLADEIQKLIKSIKHRPRHTNTNAYKSFIATLSDKMETLSKQYSFLDFGKENEMLNQR
jgi:hypothetical protein